MEKRLLPHAVFYYESQLPNFMELDLSTERKDFAESPNRAFYVQVKPTYNYKKEEHLVLLYDINGLAWGATFYRIDGIDVADNGMVAILTSTYKPFKTHFLLLSKSGEVLFRHSFPGSTLGYCRISSEGKYAVFQKINPKSVPIVIVETINNNVIEIAIDSHVDSFGAISTEERRLTVTTVGGNCKSISF